MSDLATEPPSLLRPRARLRRVWHCSLVVAALLVPVSGTPAMAGDVLVFAAASLRGALDAVAEDWARSTGQRATLSFAGSSVLARQIQQGAPADVFVSANPDWMAVIEAEGLVLPGTQRDLLGNRLVLIAPSDTETGEGAPLSADAGGVVPVLDADFDMVAALGGGRLAMALVDGVPAGIYGRQALETLGLWETARAHVAQADNVRGALALVAAGEAPLGIVYATDARAEPRVRVVAEVPPSTHVPIRYPVAAIKGAEAAASAFLTHLTSPAARAIFVDQGFVVID